uniref:Uncharacterized protein n=1 Tax=Timema poppense TaxID=170557 RepID=A0A7R9CIB3_TIMPO|nr:unnamed protein product [Timema poppensis]
MKPGRSCFARRVRQCRNFAQLETHYYKTQSRFHIRQEYGAPLSPVYKTRLIQRVEVRPPLPQKVNVQQTRVVCQKIRSPPRLQPIGDVCTCGSLRVTPAHLPRQRCSACRSRSPYYKSLAQEAPLPYYGYGSSFGGGYESFYSDVQQQRERVVEEAAEEKELGSIGGSCGGGGGPQHSLSPADAVSLTLAYGLAQNAERAVREEGLLYGPRSIPKEGAIKKLTNALVVLSSTAEDGEIEVRISVISNIPEERLQSFDKQVVELRLPSGGYGCSRTRLEQEAQEALFAAQEEELENAVEGGGYPAGGRYISYLDLGYVPESVNKQQFITGPNIDHREEIYTGGDYGGDYGGEYIDRYEGGYRGGYGGGEYSVVEQDGAYDQQESVGLREEEQYEQYEEGGEYVTSEEEESESSYNVIASSSSGGFHGGHGPFLHKLGGCGSAVQ